MSDKRTGFEHAQSVLLQRAFKQLMGDAMTGEGEAGATGAIHQRIFEDGEDARQVFGDLLFSGNTAVSRQIINAMISTVATGMLRDAGYVPVDPNVGDIWVNPVSHQSVDITNVEELRKSSIGQTILAELRGQLETPIED